MARTPLYQTHVDMGAKMVDFAGWDMPIQYAGLKEEHHQVRKDAGMFDVSHMTTVDLTGERVREFLSYLVANDVAKVTKPGKALYTCMLNEQGGVIDDLIIYYMSETWFRLVVNAATRVKDLAWIEQHAGDYGVDVNERSELAMIAVQGPNAIEKSLKVLPEDAHSAVKSLDRFEAIEHGEFYIARTGYTGEDGLEILMPEKDVSNFWLALKEAGVEPIGLGARDTLRLEAGMNLYGNDMTEETSPLESGLGWTVAMKDERSFVGRNALEKQKEAGVEYKLTGVVLTGRGVMRGHQKVFQNGEEVGELTSAGFSPTLEKSIGFARIKREVEGDVQIEIRNKFVDATLAKYPFVRDGKSCL